MARVYVSSTIADLEDERRAVMEWLIAANHQPIHSYVPDTDTVRDSCLEDVLTCDLYVVIIGHRYGFQPSDNNPDKLSITHLEFRQAKRIPRIALLRTSIPDVRLSDLEDPNKAPLILAFRAEVQGEVRSAEFSDMGGLIQGLSTGIQHTLEKLDAAGRQPFDGWLDAHLDDISRQFVNHMSASALKAGAKSEDLYLDLVVTRRRPGSREGAQEKDEVAESHSLEELLLAAQSPLLLVGEGGGGKTTSLLYVAARAADRAKAEPDAPIPVYVNLARLTTLKGVADLQQLIADSVRLARNWDDLVDLASRERRHLLLLFDSFNEIPEQLQSTCAIVLSRFIEKHRNEHICLIASRLVPHVELLRRPPLQIETFEILRLTADQVQAFFRDLGLGTLYDRMPQQLRELAGNPFMLLAIVGTLAGNPESALPRNRGRLYESFVHGWMKREANKRTLRYSFERVKAPILGYFAKWMTSSGQTFLEWQNDVEVELEQRLEEIHGRIKRRGGMPGDWTVDDCLEEILRDGLLKRVNDRLHFMHQSVQEYFTGLCFIESDPSALVEFTPKLIWDSVATYSLAEVPNHRLVSPLLMMVGLLDNATAIIEQLAQRNPLLAAAAIASANRVDGSSLSQLEQAWIELLDHKDLQSVAVGCSSLVLARMKSARVVESLTTMFFSDGFDVSYIAQLALEQLGAPEAIAMEIARQVRAAGEEDIPERRVGLMLQRLHNHRIVEILFHEWRAAPADSAVRRRFERFLATVDRSLLQSELERIRSTASDPVIAADAARALGESELWEGADQLISARRLRQIFEQARADHADAVREAKTGLVNADDAELILALESGSTVSRSAAAIVAAERQRPLADAMVKSLLTGRRGWGYEEIVSALVSLCGDERAIAKLNEATAERCWSVAQLDPRLAVHLALGELPPVLRTELERLGIDAGMTIEESVNDGDMVIWKLHPMAWSGLIRPLFEMRASPGRLELFDCSIRAKAFDAIALIPGDAALNELRRAVDHDDTSVRTMAIKALAQRGDQELVDFLRLLRSPAPNEVIDAALDALRSLRNREALVLFDELLLISDGEWSDVHPVWGPCHHSPGWAAAIHGVLVALDADAEVRQLLGKALASERVADRLAAAREFERWFLQQYLGPERSLAWRSDEHLRQLFVLASSDSDGKVREAATAALAAAGPEWAAPWIEALTGASEEAQLAAAAVLIRLKAQEQYGRIVEIAMHIIRGDRDLQLRRRAGEVLTMFPDALQPFHEPIQEALGSGENERALELIAETLTLFPSDVELYWWRGHALRNLGRLSDAADSYQQAAKLAGGAAVIPQALAETFLDLRDYPRAVEAARRAVQIAPNDADAEAILAWSSYQADAVDDAVNAASRAIDNDPVHNTAIWILPLAHLRKGGDDDARSAVDHALRVCRLLSPRLDRSSAVELLSELKEIRAGRAESPPIITEMEQALASMIAGES